MAALRCPICRRRLVRSSVVIKGKRAWDCPADPHTEWVPEPEPRAPKVRKPIKGQEMKTVDLRVIVNDSVSASHLLDSLHGSKAVLAAAMLENTGFGHLLPSTRPEHMVTFDRWPGDPRSARELIENPTPTP